jgi:hypothetical protein
MLFDYLELLDNGSTVQRNNEPKSLTTAPSTCRYRPVLRNVDENAPLILWIDTASARDESIPAGTEPDIFVSSGFREI